MSKELIEEYKKLHEKGDYGKGDPRIQGLIKEEFLSNGKNPSQMEVLDYGCGRSQLLEYLGVNDDYKYRYDPAIEEFSEPIGPDFLFDAVVCNDVLEHIPEDELPAFLAQIYSYSNFTVFTIHCDRAKTFLSNGQNAHCTVRPIAWWVSQIKLYFTDTDVSFKKVEGTSKFIVTCKHKNIKI